MVIAYGSRARKLPAPPPIVWDSLTSPQKPGARPWLDLLEDDQILLELAADETETSLRFTLLTPDERPDDSKTGHIRRRINQLLFADLRFSYGQ
ncbi:MAG: hypothetical protein ACTHOK_19430 [Nocardioidaceae bacterium]